MRFWKARFTRLYPVYLLSLLMSWRMVSAGVRRPHARMFWTGMVLTPLLLQGWIPQLATFLNTPAWTMSAEAFMYALFPWLAKVKRPARVRAISASDGRGLGLGMVPGLLYLFFQPDGIAHPDRWS